MDIIVARLMDGNSVYGYNIQLENGQFMHMTKEQTVEMAREGRLLNVKPAGKSYDSGITGINGFELKKLPSVSIKLPEFDVSTTFSSLVRHYEEFGILLSEKPNGIDREYMHNIMNKFVSVDYYNGSISLETVHANSDKLALMGIVQIQIRPAVIDALGVDQALKSTVYLANGDGHKLYDLLKKKDNTFTTTVLEEALSKSTVGYIIKNVSSGPLYTILGVINPNESRILREQEAVMVISSVTINGKIINARIAYDGESAALRKVVKTNTSLDGFRLSVDRHTGNEKLDKKDLTVDLAKLPIEERIKLISPEELHNFCLKALRPRMSEETYNSLFKPENVEARKKFQDRSVNKITAKGNKKGLMGMFKR